MSVRGGFDSHAFPPVWVALFLVVIGTSSIAARGRCELHPPAAAEAEPDTLMGPAASDSLDPTEIDASGDLVDSLGAVEPRRPRRVVIRRSELERGRFDEPRWVMLRSLVVPGWGQLHNHSWIKAVALAGSEAFLAFKVVDDKRKLDGLLAEVDGARAAGDDSHEAILVDRYNSQLSQYQSREWLLGGLVVYAMLDAYIDAHFRDFKIEFEHGDPALPDSREVRLSLRWNY